LEESNMAINNFKDLLQKVEKVGQEKNLDLSSGEDLSVGIMNLISIEEHLFFTYGKTGKNKYLDLLNEVRQLRTSLLKEIIKDYEGEVWCISKHLLAASMRLIEVGTKELKKGDKKKAEKLFDNAYKLYNLFWGLNLKEVGLKAKDDGRDINFISDKKNTKSTVSVFANLGKIIQKALDCCKE